MTLLSVGVRVGGDEVVEDDQKEEGDAEHVGEHGELRVGDHFDFDLPPAAKGKLEFTWHKRTTDRHRSSKATQPRLRMNAA